MSVVLGSEEVKGSPPDIGTWLFFDGSWIQLATDSSDGVPRTLTFEKPEATKASMEKDWAEYDAEHPYQPHPRTGVAGGSHDEHGNATGHVANTSPPLDIKSGVDVLRTPGSGGAKALDNYTSDEDGEMNQHMRGQDKSPSASTKIDCLAMESVTRGAKTSVDSTVFRGVGPEAGINKLKVGDSFTDKGFVSTTNDVGVARSIADESNGGAMLSIALPSGTYGYPGESAVGEFILANSTTFNVNSIDSAGVYQLGVSSQAS